MENFNYDQKLDSLNAGREFADYLVMNGWDITNLFIGSSTQSLDFQKGNAIIEYIITDKGSSFKTSVSIPQLKGWHEQNYVFGPDIEADVTKFAFLCHALGWVNMKEANKNCKADDNGSLFEQMANLVKEDASNYKKFIAA